VLEVSDIRSLSLTGRPCSDSSLASGKISLVDDNADQAEVCPSPTTSCQLADRDQDAIVSPDVVAADDRPRDPGAVFPVKPPQHATAAPCPSSPPSDVRTSAEGRPCDGDDEQITHDDLTPDDPAAD